MKCGAVCGVPSSGPDVQANLGLWFAVSRKRLCYRLFAYGWGLVAYLRGAMSLRPVTEHLCLRWRAAFASQQIVTLAFGAKHIPFGMLFIANDFCIPVIYIG